MRAAVLMFPLYNRLSPLMRPCTEVEGLNNAISTPNNKDLTQASDAIKNTSASLA